MVICHVMSCHVMSIPDWFWFETLIGSGRTGTGTIFAKIINGKQTRPGIDKVKPKEWY